jgi:glycyl-tRNA synthetase
MDVLKQDYMCQYDEKDAIGRRYRRQDAIGTPYCITIDHQSLTDNCVTIRERDSMQQDRIPVENISRIVRDKIKMIG